MPRWLSEGISVYEERQENPAWGQPMNLVYRQRILDGGLTPVSELSRCLPSTIRPNGLVVCLFRVVAGRGIPDGKRTAIQAVRDVLTDLGRGTSTAAALEGHIDSLDKLDADFEDVRPPACQAIRRSGGISRLPSCLQT